MVRERAVSVDARPLDLHALHVAFDRARAEEESAARILTERRVARIRAEDALRAAERGLPTTPQASEAAWRRWWNDWDASGVK
jgi:hypothetical protein